MDEFNNPVTVGLTVTGDRIAGAKKTLRHRQNR